jgi:hypothetical protein
MNGSRFNRSSQDRDAASCVPPGHNSLHQGFLQILPRSEYRLKTVAQRTSLASQRSGKISRRPYCHAAHGCRPVVEIQRGMRQTRHSISSDINLVRKSLNELHQLLYMPAIKERSWGITRPRWAVIVLKESCNTPMSGLLLIISREPYHTA